MANNVVPDQTAPIGAVCSGSTLFASRLNSSVILDNYLQQTTLADVNFQIQFFLGALRVNCDFVTFPWGIQGQVWYLIVLIPDLCHHSYFISNYE